MRSSGSRIALVLVDAFAAVTALGGGVALATGLEGGRFPTDWLTGTPFDSYLIPGLMLAGVVGGSAAVATVATLRDPILGGRASPLAGVVMVGLGLVTARVTSPTSVAAGTQPVAPRPRGGD